jgi:hypothetical protein
VDVFIPWPLTDETDRYGNTTQGIGRLRPGATAQSAQAEFTLLAKQIESQHPKRNGIIPRLSPSEAARERTSESGPDSAGLCGWSGDVDCVRKSFGSSSFLVQAEAPKGEKSSDFSEIETMLMFVCKRLALELSDIRSTALFSLRYTLPGLSRLHQERGRAIQFAI